MSYRKGQSGARCQPARRASGVRPAFALSIALAACAPQPPPVHPGFPADPHRVVVLVPGITGAQLRDPAGGRVLWGDGRSVFFPRDRGWSLGLPVVPGADGGEVEAFALVEEVSFLGVLRKAAYAPVVRLMAANGLRPGNLVRPDPAAGFFAFPYDWRRDHAESAGELARRLEALRRLRGDAVLRVALICQSSGAYVCRWLAKYGGASLERAEAGGAAPPPTLEVSELILVGTANGGSLRILRFMNRGRVYAAGLGRRWAPETLFTWPSLYQDLPAYRRDLFVDLRGRPVNADIYDPADWRRYGWSIYGPEVAELERAGRLPPWLGGPADRDAFLARALDRARRFHRLLAADAPGFGGTRYHRIQSAYAETPARAVLEREDGRWRTRFTGDRRLAARPGLAPLLAAPGDGHATLASQRRLSPQERAALAGPPLWIREGHFEMILHPAAQRRLIEILAE